MPNNKSSNIESLILAKQVDMLFEQGISYLVIGALIMPLLVAYVLWDVVDSDVLVSWVVAILILNSYRAFVFRQYAKSDKNILNTKRWAIYFTILVFLSGSLWGFAGYHFIQEGQPLINAFVILISMGVVAGTMPWQSSYVPAITTFTLTALLPLSLRLALEQERIYIVFAISIILFIITVLMISRSIQRLIRESIILRFEQSELVEDLRKV